MTGADATRRKKQPASIPETVQEEIDRAGGIEGLVSQVPAEKDLLSMARAHQALSDPIRLKALYLLAAQPLCVCVIKEVLGIADSKLSYHLTTLKEAGLIEGEQWKSWIIYRLTERGRSCIPKDALPRPARKASFSCCPSYEEE